MKALIIQENGRHEANRAFRECFCLQRGFLANGWEADVWGLGHDNFSSPIQFDAYDLILNIENYTHDWLPDLSNIHTIKMLWSIDAHVRGSGVFEQLFRQGGYHLLLHATRDFCYYPYHRWFPNAYDETLIGPRPDVAKVHPIGFCGNYVNRTQILEYLIHEIGLHTDIFVIGENMVRAINSYGIHFNLNVANDVNYRTFETIGCGTILMTNYNPQLDALGFVHGENCLIYKTIAEAIALFKVHQASPNQDIGEKGLELAAHHTYTKRVTKLIEYYEQTN